MISLEELKEWLENYGFGNYVHIQTFLLWTRSHAKSDLEYKLKHKEDLLDKERAKIKLHEALKGV